MSRVKKCTHCNKEKPLDQFNKNNISPKGKQYYQSRCKPCHYIHRLQWKKDNPEKIDQYKKWGPIFRESEGKGVYLVKYRWINFYVGEGWFHDRKDKHLKYKFNKDNKSDVARTIEQRNLNRKYLSFHVLEHLDDKAIMLERETYYRRELKPYLNPLD